MTIPAMAIREMTGHVGPYTPTRELGEIELLQYPL